MPSSRPLVQTLVAMKSLSRKPSSAMRSPATDSAAPYMGEESTTLPPAFENAASTSRNGARSAAPAPTLNTCQVPRPTAGSSSPEEGILRVMMVCAWLRPDPIGKPRQTPPVRASRRRRARSMAPAILVESGCHEAARSRFAPRRGKGARLVVRLFLLLARGLLRAAAAARRDGRGGRRAQPAVAVHRDLPHHARRGAGLRRAGRAPAAAALHSAGLSLLRLQPRGVLVLPFLRPGKGRRRP